MDRETRDGVGLPEWTTRHRLHQGVGQPRRTARLRLRVFHPARLRAAIGSAAGVPTLPDAGVGDGQRAVTSSLLLVDAMTARITVVTGGHLSTSPRMLKTADALHQEGYQVRVVSVRHTPWATAADLVVRSTRTWRSDVVDY